MINEEKKVIRKQIKEIKKEYSLKEKKEKSKLIFEQVEKLNAFQKSEIIMAYWSMDDEVFTQDFIQKYQNIKKIILPVVNGDRLDLKEFKGLSNLKTKNFFGIGEPEGELFKQNDKIGVIVVPGVAFDKSLNRLGRGKAYYDKLLKESKALKIGVCFDFQLIEKVPTDEYDVKMDLIVTNKGKYGRKNSPF
jgi:5-formyltetrahydrofolate cyclo-ligase